MNFLQTGIKNYVLPDPPTIAIDATAQDAVKALKSSSYRTVYTLSDDKKLAGVITFYDLEKFAAPEDSRRPKTAKELSTSKGVIAIREDAELWQLLKIINGENAANKSFDQLPVLNNENKLVGIVTRNNLRSALETVQIPVSAAAMF